MNGDISNGDYRESFQYFNTIDKRKIDVSTSIGDFDYHFQDILYTYDKRILVYFSYHNNYPNTSSLRSPNFLSLKSNIYVDESSSMDFMPILLQVPLTYLYDSNSIFTTNVRSYKNIGILQLQNIETMPESITIEIFNPDSRIDLIPILDGGTQ